MRLANEAKRQREHGVMPGSFAMTTPPAFEAHTDSAPNSLMQLIRERPDAVARTTIIAVACTLFWLTWAHWGDVQVDCGREVYIPYQILRGKLLYRDLWYSYGPLAPYASALLLKLFGQHLSVLYFFGLTLTICCALILYELGSMLSGRAVGLTAALPFLFQGFEPPTQRLRDVASQFNYVFPYAYAAMIGLLLALLCAFLTVRHLLGRDGHNLMLAGLAASFAFLSKQEIGAACYLMLAFVGLMEAILQRSSGTLLYAIAQCAPGVVLWVVTYGWFFWTLTPGFMLSENWIEFPGSYFMRTSPAHFYADSGARFMTWEVSFLIISGCAALFLWYEIALWSARTGRRWYLIGVVILLVAIRAAGTLGLEPAEQAMHGIQNVAFPAGMFFIGCAFLVWTLYKLRDTGERRFLAQAAIGVLALALAVRILAGVRPYGYGIFYGAPLFLVFIITLAKCVGAAVPTIPAAQRRKLTNSLLAVEVSMLAMVLIPGVSRRIARLETSWGEIYLRPEEASVARQIIDFVSEQGRRGRRIAILPEAPIMYALTGTEAPNRWYMVAPGFLSPSQEDDYIADLKRSGTDYIVLTTRNTSEYGAPYFGIDYDRKIYQWIKGNYRVVEQFGRFRRDGSRELAAIVYQRTSLPRTRTDHPLRTVLVGASS
jgi:hypothetical protein